MRVKDVNLFILDFKKKLGGDINVIEVTNNLEKALNEEPKIWMFRPCDKNGNLMELPIMEGDDVSTKEYISEFYEACDRMWFSGYKVIERGDNRYLINQDLDHVIVLDNNNTFPLHRGENLKEFLSDIDDGKIPTFTNSFLTKQI